MAATSTHEDQPNAQVQADTYAGAVGNAQATLPAPDLPYRPRNPRHYRPGIGLIGCGGITTHHLTAYRAAGYNVVAFCDVERGRAEAQRAAFYPDADVYVDYRDLLQRDDVEVVDIATHPPERVALIEAALR